MSKYFPKPKTLGGNAKVELDLPNHATKFDLKPILLKRFI